MLNTDAEFKRGPRNWLADKIIALVAYIAIGTTSLKRGATKTQPACTFCAALAVFLYVGLVAITERAMVFS
ncbi:MAG: SirB2 family protein [Aeromicrobium sp.]|nr:SirB2 family protein [Burkholderiales bacterium]